MCRRSGAQKNPNDRAYDFSNRSLLPCCCCNFIQSDVPHSEAAPPLPVLRPLSESHHRAERSRSDEPFRLTLSTALHTPPVSLLVSGAFFGGGERAVSPPGVHGDFGGDGLAQFPDQSPLAAAIAGDGNASLAGSGVLLDDPNQLPSVSIHTPPQGRMTSVRKIYVPLKVVDFRFGPGRGVFFGDALQAHTGGNNP
jgi:hypothetical protein